MQRPLFRQMGGPAQPMPQDMIPPPPAPAMMPPPPAPAMMPPAGAEQQVAEAEMMGQAAGTQMADDMMMKLDGAEDYQTLIDGIRGNNLPLEARYEELATLVGEQDAMATPESVLALTQPTIMMTEQGAMDSGIGELMQGISGSVDMAGPMEEGVGSLMMAGAGNTPPVNFRDGGPVEVRRFSEGGESRILTQAERDVANYEKYFAGGLDQQARAAALEEQNKMAKAQMLFDIAGTALNFAGQTQGDSIAERLANAATQTQLTDKIGQRSAGMLASKQAQQAEERQLRMQARLASLGQAQADAKFAQELELAGAKKVDTKEATVNGVPLSIYNKLPNNEKRIILGVEDKAPAAIKGVPFEFFNKMTEADQSRLILGDPQGVNGVPRDIFDQLGQTAQDAILGTTEGPIKGIPANVFATLSDDDKKRVLLGDPQGVNGIPMSVYETLSEDDKKAVLGVTKDVKGIPMSVYETLSDDDKKRVLLGDPQGVNGVPRDIFNGLSQVAKNKVLGTGDDPIKGLPRAIFDTLSKQDQNRFILGDPQGVKGVPRDIYDALPPEARALIVDPVAQSALEVQVQKDAEDRNEQQTIRAEIRELERTLDQEERDAIAPFTRTINDKLYRIDLSKPEDDQITLLVDESTISDVFGSGTTGKVMSIVSNEDLLSKYANNTLSKEADGISPTDMEAALIAYTSPTSTAYSADAKDMVTTPGKALTSTMIEALRARKLNGLSVPTGVYFPFDALDAAVDERLGIKNGLDQAPPMTEFLGEAAWGSKAFVQNLTNNLLEFAQAPAYFTEAKDAIEAVKNLNQEFETVFLASQEIRDSVYQGKKLEELTPKPAKFFGTGPDAARSKALNLYERLKRHIQITEAQLNDPNIPMPQTGPGSLQKKQERLQTLKDLQAGYGVLAGLDLLSRGMDPADIDRSEAEQALIDELDRLSGISGGDENDPD